MAEAPEAGERLSGCAKGPGKPKGLQEGRQCCQGPARTGHLLMMSPCPASLTPSRLCAPHSSPGSLMGPQAGRLWVCLELLLYRWPWEPHLRQRQACLGEG